jgi:hypothetical protein
VALRSDGRSRGPRSASAASIPGVTLPSPQRMAGRAPLPTYAGEPPVALVATTSASLADGPASVSDGHRDADTDGLGLCGFRDRAADAGFAQAIRRETLQPTAYTGRGRRPTVVGRGRAGAAFRVVGLHGLCGVRRRLPLMYEASGMPGGVCAPSWPAGACLSACREVGVDELHGPRPFADGGGTTLG